MRVRLSGGSPERFFNLCSAGGIELWDFTYQKGVCRCSMTLPDFFKIRPYAGKAKVRLVVEEKGGEVIRVEAQSDSNIQLGIIEDFIAQDVDCVFYNAEKPEAGLVRSGTWLLFSPFVRTILFYLGDFFFRQLPLHRGHPDCFFERERRGMRNPERED